MVAFLPLCHPDAELGLGVVKFQDDIPKVLFFPGEVRILPEQAPEVEGIGQPLFLSQLGDAVQFHRKGMVGLTGYDQAERAVSLGAELLTVKDGLRLIENGKHELKTTCDTIAGFVGETERMVKAFHAGLEEMMTATYQNEWTQESKESLNRILALYSNLVKNYLDGFCNDEKKAQEDFLTELRNVFTQSENTEQRMLNNFCNDLSNVLSRNGIWFTEKVSYWLLALFCTSSAISIVMIVLLITGNVHLG